RGRARGRGRSANAGSRVSKKRPATEIPGFSDSEDDDNASCSKRSRLETNYQQPESVAENRESSAEPVNIIQVGQTCAALISNRQRIGCAYIDATTGILYLFEDTQDGAHFDISKQLLEQVDPDFVITSGRADNGFIEACRAFSQQGKAAVTSILSAVVKSRETVMEPNIREAYGFTNNRGVIDNEDPTMARWQASVRAANFVETDRSPLCMACVGALFDHLVRTRALGELGDDMGSIVTSIEILRLDSYMQINMDALFSLQIFQEQNHASMYSEKTKEGLSLFGTLNNTKTRFGADLLRQWFLRPSLSLEVIRARHDALSMFLRPDNVDTCGSLRAHLGGVRNVPTILTAVRQGRGGMKDWEALCRFTYHAAMLAEALAELISAEHIGAVQQLKAVLTSTTFTDMGTDVNNTIDWEESALQERVCVKRDIDSNLDDMKTLYDGLDSLMATHSQFSSALNLSVGFLVSVALPQDWTPKDPLFTAVPDWKYQFNTDATVFFKSSKMHDLDRHIGDIQTLIVARELEIVHELYERVMPYAPAVESACSIMAELDCLLSFAQSSLTHAYTRPNMTEDNAIAIQGGRHPLHEQVVDTFIPNDAYLVGGMGTGVADEMDEADERPEADGGMLDQSGRSILVVTGANACGKSVYLKQVALIHFVPAEHATIGLVDKIFTRVQARESISRIQSAFMIDLNQVSLALRNATGRSLVLLDEFGKGTVDTDGAGLLVGALKHLLNRGIDCPRVLATTHFRDIFREDLVPRSLPIRLAHIRVMLVNTEREEIAGLDGATLRNAAESIVYLYQVAPGLSLESHAAKCAAACGVSHAVVQRAQYVTYVPSGTSNIDLVSASSLVSLLPPR
ncbi:DNA mismatch repair protein MutS, partial [Auriculariales sp. MPI-PUGE-AT-0066]